jgi:2-succinyl-5-enolpyruvyl-6-hydroxy-3-cyclohexene-1-carboxylate synthase
VPVDLGVQHRRRLRLVVRHGAKLRIVTAQATFAATLVDEWARAGVRHAVVAPGSRSTPLALALANHERIAVHVHHDERCAGFIGLGIGLATGCPAVVLTTSGTATTHLHAAVVEAHQAGVPLIVATADRPPELRGVAAPQTIDQTGLYGGAVRWFHDPGVADDATRSTWRSTASRAAAEATGGLAGRPGPVHLNLPFREPLLGDVDELPPGRVDGSPWHVVTHAPDTAGGGPPLSGRGFIVAGAGAPMSLADGPWPVLADARSGLCGPAVVAHADALLRDADLAVDLRPDIVLHVGHRPASRVVAEWIANSGAREIVVAGQWADPSRTAAELRAAVPALTDAPAGWLERWREVDDAAEAAITATLAAHDEPTEPGTARAVLAALPPGGHLVVSSSMPVRDLEWYARPRADVVVHANRGANGIDGVVSTAVGVALATGASTACLVGDVAFLHDTNALLGVADRDLSLTIVVVDNDGGGIFSFLPQASAIATADFELLFGTPHGVRVEDLAAAHGLTSLTIESDDILEDVIRASLPHRGVRLVVVRTDRAANVELHAELNAAVASRIGG